MEIAKWMIALAAVVNFGEIVVDAIVPPTARQYLRKATMTALSSTDRTVDRGSLGPVLWSAVEVRFFHFATVFGLTP